MNIGMLMTRNEEDVIAEVMTEYSKYFDTIFCLDNSTDNTLEIIKSFPKVEFAKTEKELGVDSRVMKDGIRQVLLEEIQKRYGYEGWIFCINGDEIFNSNPTNLIEYAERSNSNVLNGIIANFVLHPSDKGVEYDINKSVTEQRLWYFLSQAENVAFKNKEGLYYISGEHMKVIPRGLGDDGNTPHACEQMVIRRHYNMRSEKQLLERIEDRISRGWQPTYAVLERNIWVTSPVQVVVAGTIYSQLHQFDGIFRFDEDYKYFERLIK